MKENCWKITFRTICVFPVLQVLFRENILNSIGVSYSVVNVKEKIFLKNTYLKRVVNCFYRLRFSGMLTLIEPITCLHPMQKCRIQKIDRMFSSK